jgi:hypothetical protein
MGPNNKDSNLKMLNHQSKNLKKKLHEKKVWNSPSTFQNLKLKSNQVREKKQKLIWKKMRTMA